MNVRRGAAGLVALVLVCGCGSSRSEVGASDNAIRRDLLRGVEAIRGTKDRRQLDAQLRRVVARLREERGSTAAIERSRKVALAGFESTRKGVGSQIAFIENDRGDIAAATRDARGADRYLGRGADQIRRAGLALGIHVGKLHGY